MYPPPINVLFSVIKSVVSSETGLFPSLGPLSKGHTVEGSHAFDF
jgi:hypothetical protein